MLKYKEIRESDNSKLINDEYKIPFIQGYENIIIQKEINTKRKEIILNKSNIILNQSKINSIHKTNYHINL